MGKNLKICVFSKRLFSQKKKQVLHLDSLSNKKENEILTVKKMIKILELKKIYLAYMPFTVKLTQ